MSHGVHAVQHEVEHQIEHEEGHKSGGHGGGGHDSQNKRIALVISVLALCLAFSETLGKSAQTSALNFQIEASNLWNFFQAKNIRRTMTIVVSESAKIDAATTSDAARKAALAKQVDDSLRSSMPAWRERYPGVENMKVAVMGCIVNGPGEIRDADELVAAVAALAVPVA